MTAGLKVLWLVTIATVFVGVWLAWAAPADALQGVYSRLINIHVPSLWLAFLAFGITALGSVMWLVRRRMSWDRLAEASVEVGVLFTGIGLASGMLWGWAVWGTPWDWGDPRLTSTAVMFVVYLGYLALRRAIDDPMIRARRAAVLGTIAVIQVPLVYFSVNLFRTLHQTQSIRPDGATMPSEMLLAMLFNVGAFTLLYLSLMITRIRLLRIKADSQREEATAGASIKPPRIDEVEDV